MRLVTFLALAASCLRAADAPVEFLPKDEFLRDWEISKQFTIAVARKMPAEHYGFKPSEEQMSFGAQMVHIAASLLYRFAEIRGQKPAVDHMRTLKDKDAVIQAVSDAYDFAIATIRNVTAEQMKRNFKVDWEGRPETDGRNMIVNMFVHAAHHRAACEVYLRLKGITPPTYTF